MATVPSMVATSDAPLRAVRAAASESLAVLTVAESALSWALDAPADESSLYLAWAWARSDSAWLTAAASLVESIVARTWPAVTVSPAFTLTAVTVPLEEKLRSSVAAAAILPLAEMVWSSEPVVAATTSSVGNAAAVDVEPVPERVANQ